MHIESIYFKTFNNLLTTDLIMIISLLFFKAVHVKLFFTVWIGKEAAINLHHAEDIEDVDIQQGVFSVHSQKGKVYTVNIGTTSKDNMLYCTCVDWRTHHIPCKHFFTIFQHRESWSWNNLPIEYLESSYINMDSKAIWSHHPSLSDPANDSFPILSNSPTKKPALDFLPKKVSRCDI